MTKTTLLAVAAGFVVSLGVLIGSARAGPEPHGPPPPEALNACNGKAQGDACSFSTRGQELSGTCFTPSQDLPLACRPARPPVPPQRGSHEVTSGLTGR